MSWHGVHRKGQTDPFSKPAKKGDRFGIWKVVRMVEPDAHYGLRACVTCVDCSAVQTVVLAQVRHRKPTTHRGCNPLRREVESLRATLVHIMLDIEEAPKTSHGWARALGKVRTRVNDALGETPAGSQGEGG